MVIIMVTSEAVIQRCSVKKLFIEVSPNSQENTCARDSFVVEIVSCHSNNERVHISEFRCFIEMC